MSLSVVEFRVKISIEGIIFVTVSLVTSGGLPVVPPVDDSLGHLVGIGFVVYLISEFVV